MNRHYDHEEIAARFFTAVSTGDVQQLMDLMAPDVVLLTDGGGKKQAASARSSARTRSAVGSSVSRRMSAMSQSNGPSSTVRPAVFLSVGGELDSVAGFTVTDGWIAEIYIVRNPDKLTTVRETFEVTLH